MPLTFLECVAEKPLVFKLNDKWIFITYPQKAINFAMIIDAKDSVFGQLETIEKTRPRKEDKRLEKTKVTLGLTYQLIEILFEISKQEYKDKETEYKKFLFGFLLEDINILFEIWKILLDYNTRIGKKNRVPGELQNNSGLRESDKWRGFFSGRRSSEIQTTSFLRLLHEDEAKTTQAINEWKAGKERQKQSERDSKRKSYPRR